MGVTCVEVIDTVFANDVLEELTHDWFSQDEQGPMSGTLAKMPGSSPTANKWVPKAPGWPGWTVDCPAS